MMLAKLALFVAAYIAQDVSNPLMPGALTFSVEQSVEVRQADRFRGQVHEVAPIPRAPELECLDPDAQPLRPRRLLAPETPCSRQVHVARSQLSLHAPASPSEDH
jgi:hypothetical protein